MSDVEKTRWFRFSLRKFFLVVTVLALWLGWNAYQVRQRHRIEQYVATFAAKQIIFYGTPVKPWKSFPIMWRLLGAKPVQYFDFQGLDLGEDDMEHIREWFPEAEIY